MTRVRGKMPGIQIFLTFSLMVVFGCNGMEPAGHDEEVQWGAVVPKNVGVDEVYHREIDGLSADGFWGYDILRDQAVFGIGRRLVFMKSDMDPVHSGSIAADQGAMLGSVYLADDESVVVWLYRSGDIGGAPGQPLVKFRLYSRLSKESDELSLEVTFESDWIDPSSDLYPYQSGAELVDAATAEILVQGDRAVGVHRVGERELLLFRRQLLPGPTGRVLVGEDVVHPLSNLDNTSIVPDGKYRVRLVGSAIAAVPLTKDIIWLYRGNSFVELSQSPIPTSFHRLGWRLADGNVVLIRSVENWDLWRLLDARGDGNEAVLTEFSLPDSTLPAEGKVVCLSGFSWDNGLYIAWSNEAECRIIRAVFSDE